MPTTTSNQGNEIYYAVNGPVGNIAEYLLLIYNRDGKEYKVPVFTGCLYTVQFYSPEVHNYFTVTGMVTGVCEEAIALSSIRVLDEYGKVCLNANLDKLSGYLSHESYHIPVRNIAGIKKSTPTPPPPEPVERRETIVSVLGLSSTICKAIIVRLRIFKDDIQHTVTKVDMEVGKSYHVTWVNHVNHTTYELIGKLTNIEELVTGSNTTTTENGYVRQDNQSDDFLSMPVDNPDGERICFTFDTSKPFLQLTDHVMLKDIRNVEVVTDTSIANMSSRPVTETVTTTSTSEQTQVVIPPCPSPNPEIPQFPPQTPWPVGTYPSQNMYYDQSVAGGASASGYQIPVQISDDLDIDGNPV